MSIKYVVYQIDELTYFINKWFIKKISLKEKKQERI